MKTESSKGFISTGQLQAVWVTTQFPVLVWPFSSYWEEILKLLLTSCQTSHRFHSNRRQSVGLLSGQLARGMVPVLLGANPWLPSPLPVSPEHPHTQHHQPMGSLGQPRPWNVLVLIGQCPSWKLQLSELEDLNPERYWFWFLFGTSWTKFLGC